MSTPVYALVVDYIWVSELNENNWGTRNYTKQLLLSKNLTDDDLNRLNEICSEIQPRLSLTPIDLLNLGSDSVYYIFRKNGKGVDEKDAERYRGLKSYPSIKGQAYRISIESNLIELSITLAGVALAAFFFFGVVDFWFHFTQQ
ncbi:MAG: two-component system sensor histidine kinase QseC [Gammaproteobacteria bacterium]